MNGVDFNRLVSLARTDPRFLRGGLGDEIVQGLETEDAKALAKVLIDYKVKQTPVPPENRREVDALLSLAGASPVE
jgi:hypothetical protein